MGRLRPFFTTIFGLTACCTPLIVAACTSSLAPHTTLSPTITPALVSPTRLPTTAPAPTIAERLPPTAGPTSQSSIAPLTPTPVTPTVAPTLAPTAAPQVVPTDRALAPAGVDVVAYKTELLNLINDLRAVNSCQPLEFDERLQQAAQAHAEDMRDHRRLNHTGSDGATLRDRLDRVGYLYARAGENITNWFRTPEDVMVQWTEGPEISGGPHRKNILNCAYTEAGIGLAYRGDGVPYWVLDLANREL